MSQSHVGAVSHHMQHHMYHQHNQGTPRIYFKVPRVVPKQRERFEAEDIFKRNAREQEVGGIGGANLKLRILNAHMQL
jgi:hypothetical protein